MYSMYINIYIYIYIYIYTPQGFLFLEETIEIWSEWDLNSRPMNSVQSSYRLSYTLYLIASIRTQS